ncbi:TRANSCRIPTION FACTOR BHLH83-RELATED [Salix viminalis]|uniref:TRANSCRIPTION FACTOR BHLH83-RELATED n=1 Tax=Salix viminalis TaxID=40686 RepID=A0A9Q0UUQ3_SALVM|nr:TRANSCRIPTION FACTOR BHLH83-RELATED [Salix viminalis]
MEPGNLHLQHQFQEQCTGYSSSFSSQPAEYNSVSSTSDHFNPEAAGIILNIISNTHNNYLIDCIPNSCVSLPPVSLTQGLSFCQAFSFNQQSAASELLLGKTKEEFPDSFGKLSDMMHTSSNVEETDFLSSKYKHQYSHDLVLASLQKILSIISCENLRTALSNSYNKKSTFEDGYGRKKRPNSVSQSNNFLAEAKKNRTAPRSCLTLKVRKEKLGDRIAALQLLVAPYGKTDTASVLTEAIGYIQFLHDQVQTLCATHMKSSDIKPTRTAQACSSEEDGKGKQKRDLRSRGLCLVSPILCIFL